MRLQFSSFQPKVASNVQFAQITIKTINEQQGGTAQQQPIARPNTNQKEGDQGIKKQGHR